MLWLSRAPSPLPAPGRAMTSGSPGSGSAQPRQAPPWSMRERVGGLRFSVYRPLLQLKKTHFIAFQLIFFL